jgi:tetratricopeptide (TPR) repeat protein
VQNLPTDEIRRRFEKSRDFNEIFDAFEAAIRQRIEDIGLYRTLFWNSTLSLEEICMFGEHLAKELPSLAYDAYMWLAYIFEVTRSMDDNFALAIEYYKKAAEVHPGEIDPYLEGADCYNPDLNIPPAAVLIEFLKRGAESVPEPKPLYQRLSILYELTGNDEMSQFYRRKSGAQPQQPGDPAP